MSEAIPFEPIQVRLATLGDVLVMSRCHTRSIRKAYKDFIAPSDLAIFTEDETSVRIAAQIEHGDKVLVALAEGHVIGHARWAEVEADYWPYQVLVQTLFIDPDHQGRRAGSALLGECAFGAQSNGHAGMMIGAFVDNLPASEWYVRLGARLIERAPLTVGSNEYLSAFFAFDDLSGLRERLRPSGTSE